MNRFFDLELTESERTVLYKLWDDIAGIKCKPYSYSIHSYMREAITEGGFQAFLIVGRRGKGKTTYSLKATASYYMIYEDMECGEAWQETLLHLVFTAKELISKMDDGSDIIIWDDAGVWGSTFMWYDPVMRPYIEALLDWYDVARTDINVLLMSSPNKKKLPPKIRDDEDTILVKINHNGVKYRGERKINTSIALAVRNQESLWSEKTYRPTIFTDYFSVFLPDPVYNFYSIIRKKYSEYTRTRLKAILEVYDEIGDPRLATLRRVLNNNRENKHPLDT